MKASSYIKTDSRQSATSKHLTLRSIVRYSLNVLWNQTLDFFANSSEVRIWQTRTPQGKVSWHGYDPTTGQRVTLSSEAEMRVWLEQRYRL